MSFLTMGRRQQQQNQQRNSMDKSKSMARTMKVNKKEGDEDKQKQEQQSPLPIGFLSDPDMTNMPTTPAEFLEQAQLVKDRCTTAFHEMNHDEKSLLLWTNALSWGLFLVVILFVKKRRSRRRRSKQSFHNNNDSSVLLEHDALVAALQEELHAKSVAENEQAILWRQEKRILQSRIDELLVGRRGIDLTRTNSGIDAPPSMEEEKKDESKSLHEAQLLQQVKELSETVAFLTNLTESQTQTLAVKQTELTKLHNIMEEMQRHMGETAPAAASSTASDPTEPTNNKIAKPVEFLGESTDEDTSDADSISIDSSIDEQQSPTTEKGKSRLPPGNKIVLLLSTMPGNLSTSVHQSRLEAIFRHGLQLESQFLETVDGCDSNLTSLRNDLFQISGMHAVYPQVFMIRDGDIQFVGDFETVQELHNSRALPERIGLLLPEDEEETETCTASEASVTNTASIAGREAATNSVPPTKEVVGLEGNLEGEI